MPKLALAASVPAIDWNTRSTGAPCSIARIVRRHVGQHADLRRDLVALRSARRACCSRRDRRCRHVSVAGLMPITASPQP